jgi:hypothetical protein
MDRAGKKRAREGRSGDDGQSKAGWRMSRTVCLQVAIRQHDPRSMSLFALTGYDWPVLEA